MRRGVQVAWFAGTEVGTGRAIRGLHLPACRVGKGRTVLYDPYRQQRYVTDAATLRPIAPVRLPRVVRVSRPQGGILTGMSRIWHRELGGKLYKFIAVVMPTGELRTVVREYTGAPEGPVDRIGAWDSIRHSVRRPRERCACPSCGSVHKVIGTCTTCRNLVCRSCDGSVVHADAVEIYERRHGEHAARWLQAPGVELTFRTAECA